MTSNAQTLAVIKAILSLVQIMERRLLLCKAPELYTLVQAMLTLKKQADVDIDADVATLTSVATQAQSNEGGALVLAPATEDAAVEMWARAAGQACLLALGVKYEEDTNEANSWTMVRASKYAANTLILLQDMRRDPWSPLEWVPLDLSAPLWPGRSGSFDITSPAQDQLLTIGDECAVTWLRKPGSTVDLVRLYIRPTCTEA